MSSWPRTRAPAPFLAYDSEARGPSDVWVMKQLARDLRDRGRRAIHLKTDGEPAIVEVQNAVAAIREDEKAQAELHALQELAEDTVNWRDFSPEA